MTEIRRFTEKRSYDLRGIDISVDCSITNLDQSKSILFLHGYMDHSLSFEPILKFVPDCYNCFSMDLRGHGDSGHNHRAASYHLIDYAMDVVHLVKTMKLESFIIVGHSFGSALAFLATAGKQINPERLVFLDSLGPFPYNPKDFPARIHRFHNFEFGSELEKFYEDKNYMIQHAKKKHFSGNESIAEFIAENNIKLLETGKYAWKFDHRVRYLSPLPPAEDIYLKSFSELEMPVLTIFSKMASFYKSGKRVKARAEAIKNHEIEVYEDMSHHLHMEYPEMIWERISKFLNSKC